MGRVESHKEDTGDVLRKENMTQLETPWLLIQRSYSYCHSDFLLLQAGGMSVGIGASARASKHGGTVSFTIVRVSEFHAHYMHDNIS